MERAAPLIERTFLKTAPSWLPWFRSTSRHATLHYFCRKICPRQKLHFYKIASCVCSEEQVYPARGWWVSSKSFPSLFPTRVFCSKATCLVRHRHSAGGLYILPPRLTNSCVLHRQTAHADINQNCGLVSNMTSIVTSDLPSSILSL